MKIAILGIRGIPSCYSGFETFAEELSIRLVEKGHSVSVYCRPQYVQLNKRAYKGANLIVLPTIQHKYFDTIVHTFLSTVHLLFTPIEVAYYCNPINSIFTIIPRLFGKKTIINVDGLEWRRSKWNSLGKLMHKLSEYLASIFPNAIVTDSKAIRNYYKEKFKVNTEYISYGANIQGVIPSGSTMQKYGLRKREYILYVSRLEPENNAHILIKAYEKVKTAVPLVIVGDAPYNQKYISMLKSTHDKRIIFTGKIFGHGYYELLGNALIYVHCNEVGGTNPALLQAMASGNCIIVNGVEFNKEVINSCGLFYQPGDVNDLKDKIEYLLGYPEEVGRYRMLAVDRIRKYYNWELVTDQTERLIQRLLLKRNS
jgi:glycosyltransferase involved in cell wall biosynthesis